LFTWGKEEIVLKPRLRKALFKEGLGRKGILPIFGTNFPTRKKQGRVGKLRLDWPNLFSVWAPSFWVGEGWNFKLSLRTGFWGSPFLGGELGLGTQFTLF